MTAESSNIYQSEAERIIALLRRDFVLANGALSLGIKNGVKSPHHILPDLGDTLPFLLHFGANDLVVGQIKSLEQILHNNILLSEFPTLGISGLAKSYEYSDFLFGLIEYYSYQPTDQSRNLLLTHVKKAIEIFNFAKHPNSFYSPRFNLHLPITDSRDGMMIELFVELDTLFPGSGYLAIAQNIYHHLLDNSYYQTHHLLPTFAGPKLLALLLKDFSSAEICKPTTNTLFALLSLWQATKDPLVEQSIVDIVGALEKLAIKDKGGVIKNYNNKIADNRGFLTASFAILDFLCDFYQATGKEEYLTMARDMADYWLAKQGQTGLFPLYSDGVADFVDSQTDMTVALTKLYELSSDNRYQLAAEACYQGLVKYHGQNNYVLSVDINTGQVINNQQKTKFLTLFLKLLILKQSQAQGQKIYDNKQLFNLLKDR